MPQKVFVYAQTHDERGSDKVLVIKEPHRDVFTLPQADVPEGKYPEGVACEVLETQTGLGIYPDHRHKGIILTEPMEFIRFPHLEGKLLAGNMEVLCYSIEVNELLPVQGNAIWIPWWTLRWDERMSNMMRFVMALLYAGISGWEIRLDEQGNWTLPYFCTEGRRNNTVDEILSGDIKIEVYDTLQEVVRKSIEYHNLKYKERKEEETRQAQPPAKETWLFKLFRRLGMLN